MAASKSFSSVASNIWNALPNHQGNNASTKGKRDQIFDRIRESGIHENNKKLLIEGKKESLAKESSKNRENEEVVVLASDFIREPIFRFTKKMQP